MAWVKTSSGLLLLALGASHNATAASDGLPRGWTSAPYVRYEAESGARAAGALLRTAFDVDPAKTAVEASDRQYVGLPSAGSHVEWVVTNSGAGLWIGSFASDTIGPMLS